MYRDGSGAHPLSYSRSSTVAVRSVELATDLHLVLGLRISGPITHTASWRVYDYCTLIFSFASEIVNLTTVTPVVEQ